MRRPTARRAVLVTVLALSLALVGTGCDEAEDLAQQAQEQAEETAQLVQFCESAIRVARAVQDRDWDTAIAEGEDLVDHAPDDIVDQARTVLEGARRLRDGDTSVAQDEDFQDAANQLEAYTRDHCNPAD